VISFLRKKNKELGLGLNTSDILFSAQIVCRNDGLTIGAPSSPKLTNIMMFDFDSEISKWCKAQDLSYSRYADDIFISAIKPDKLAAALKHLRKALNNFKFAELQVNEDKMAFLSRRYRRNITGLVVTPDHRISIGLEKKLKLKSDLYKFTQGILAPEALGSLVGMIAFTNDVEPTFVENLRRKYGAETIAKLTNQAKINHFSIGRKFSEPTRLSRRKQKRTAI
jgi:RNA-directed DNA polymerase